MKHVHENIVGWFDYEDLFEEMVKKASEGARFVEIGVFVGKSTTHLLVEKINSGKNIQIDTIDNFSCVIYDEWPWSGPRDQYRCFKWNMERFSLIDHVNIIREDSVKSASEYQDGSVDFVFIDTSHAEKSTKQEIEAWLPKIKKRRLSWRA